MDFAEATRPLLGHLVSIARRILGDEDAARDAVQEALVSLWLEDAMPVEPSFVASPGGRSSQPSPGTVPVSSSQARDSRHVSSVSRRPIAMIQRITWKERTWAHPRRGSLPNRPGSTRRPGPQRCRADGLRVDRCRSANPDRYGALENQSGSPGPSRALDQTLPEEYQVRRSKSPGPT